MGDVFRVRLAVLGTIATVRISGGNARRLLESVISAWTWCLEDGTSDVDGPSVDAVLDADPAVVSAAREGGAVASGDLRELMHWLTPAITTAAITHRAGSVLMLHACAVAHPSTGATVVLVGPSGMGKTTLARTLGTRLGYLTDETAAIETDLTVLPFPKPLSVLVTAADAIKEQVSPETLGLHRPPQRTGLSAVILLNRQTGSAADPRVETVSTVRALAMLAEHTSYLTHLDCPLKRLAAMLNATGGLRRVTYGEAEDLVALVDELTASAA